jgi:Tol biopolymer transport system component
MVSAADLHDVERSSPKIAPDGARLAYLRSDPAGGGSLWIRSRGDASEERLTAGRRHIGEFRWSPDGRWLLTLEDEGGDENWRLFAVDAASRRN